MVSPGATAGSSSSAKWVHDCSYDNRHQLTAANYDTQADESYAYDDNGNRDQDITNSAGTFDYTTGDANRMTSDGVYNYEYDNEGNLTTRTSNATGDYTVYEWDHRNRLTAIREFDSTDISTSFEHLSYDAFNQWIYRYYDGDGVPQSKLDASRSAFVYDEGQIVLQFDYAATLGGIPAAGLRHRYLWAAAVDQLLADEALADGETLWAMTDHLGSVRDVVDDNGTLRKHTQYDSYGRVTGEEYFDTAGDPIAAAHAEAIAQLFGFTGRPLDEFSGLQNNLHRWYDPAVGRWVSEDPIKDGTNWSAYVGNSPAMFVDPDGLEKQNVIDADKDDVDEREINDIGKPVTITTGDLTITLTIDADPTQTIVGHGGWPKMPHPAFDVPMYTGPGIIVVDNKSGQPCGVDGKGTRTWISAVRVVGEWFEHKGKKKILPDVARLWPKLKWERWYTDQYIGRPTNVILPQPGVAKPIPGFFDIPGFATAPGQQLGAPGVQGVTYVLVQEFAAAVVCKRPDGTVSPKPLSEFRYRVAYYRTLTSKGLESEVIFQTGDWIDGPDWQQLPPNPDVNPIGRPPVFK